VEPATLLSTLPFVALDFGVEPHVKDLLPDVVGRYVSRVELQSCLLIRKGHLDGLDAGKRAYLALNRSRKEIYF
jgi:hypothetical protein